MKTKKRHKKPNPIFSLIASLVVVAVFLTAMHAKDIVNDQPLPSQTDPVTEAPLPRPTKDPLQKSLGELHHHTDNTTVKNFGKAFSGDAPSLAAKRQLREEDSTEDKPLSQRLLEVYLMVQLAYASVRA